MYLWVPLQTPGAGNISARIKRTLLRKRRHPVYDSTKPSLKVRLQSLLDSHLAMQAPHQGTKYTCSRVAGQHMLLLLQLAMHVRA